MMKSRGMRWAEHVRRVSEKRNPYRISSEKARREDITRQTQTCEDNIKIDLREMGCARMDWIHLAQRTLVNRMMELRVP
jgi:hypothetical protein